MSQGSARRWRQRAISLPTYRAHNEQAMAHAAIAFAKAMNRRRMMACTTSIGPGATNMVTAAAVAHVNRLPAPAAPGRHLRQPAADPVLQQIEVVGDPTATANDCFRPVSRYFDRITRPEQLVSALPQAVRVLTDPAECGPVTLCLPQDVQAEACDFPRACSSAGPRGWRRPEPDRDELGAAAEALRHAERPLIVAGGGVKYSLASETLAALPSATACRWPRRRPARVRSPGTIRSISAAIGVTGSTAANTLAARGRRGPGGRHAAAGLHHRIARAVQQRQADRSSMCQAFDATKHDAQPLVADAQAGLSASSPALGDWRAPSAWTGPSTRRSGRMAQDGRQGDCGTARQHAAERCAGARRRQPPDQPATTSWSARQAGCRASCTSCGGPTKPAGYHLEYGYSCMGYEIAGGLGVKLALPDRRVVVLVGDGSYLMMNSEIATSIMLGAKLDIVVLDNRGFGCIDRLQRSCGIESFNNLLKDTVHLTLPTIDFATHAAALGALAEQVTSISALEAALDKARASDRTHVIVIETDPAVSTAEGGAWWDVPVPEVSSRGSVKQARKAYEQALAARDQK